MAAAGRKLRAVQHNQRIGQARSQSTYAIFRPCEAAALDASCTASALEYPIRTSVGEQCGDGVGAAVGSSPVQQRVAIVVLCPRVRAVFKQRLDGVAFACQCSADQRGAAVGVPSVHRCSSRQQLPNLRHVPLRRSTVQCGRMRVIRPCHVAAGNHRKDTHGCRFAPSTIAPSDRKADQEATARRTTVAAAPSRRGRRRGGGCRWAFLPTTAKFRFLQGARAAAVTRRRTCLACGPSRAYRRAGRPSAAGAGPTAAAASPARSSPTRRRAAATRRAAAP